MNLISSQPQVLNLCMDRSQRGTETGHTRGVCRNKTGNSRSLSLQTHILKLTSPGLGSCQRKCNNAIFR